jgi:hypothetical protein
MQDLPQSTWHTILHPATLSEDEQLLFKVTFGKNQKCEHDERLKFNPLRPSGNYVTHLL